MGTGSSSMAESDNTVELLKNIRDEIRGVRNELRDEIRGVRTERLEPPEQARRRRMMLLGVATGAAAFVVCLFLFRGGEKGEGDKKLAAVHVVEVESTPRPAPSVQNPPTPAPPMAAAPEPVAAPRPAVAVPTRATARRKAALEREAELEPAKL
jgi:hypothetical protein